jgi:hypothetical protein
MGVMKLVSGKPMKLQNMWLTIHMTRLLVRANISTVIMPNIIVYRDMETVPMIAMFNG